MTTEIIPDCGPFPTEEEERYLARPRTVQVTIVHEELDGDYGRRPVLGVVAFCSRCNTTTESYGTDVRSIRRCLALLRETCPRNESNFYVTGEER